MPLTAEELKFEIGAIYKDRTDAEWDACSQSLQVATKDDAILATEQIPGMVAKINRLDEQLAAGVRVTVPDGLSDIEIVLLVNETRNPLSIKRAKCLEVLGACFAEQRLRTAQFVERQIIHTNYYIDYANGIDTATGTKQGNFTADAGTNATAIVDTELDGLTITDNAASTGDYIWNVTRSLGGYVDAWDDGTDTITLVGAGIAGQTAGDTYYIISAWKTITKFTEAARSAGDTAYLRANITWAQGTEAASITFTSDGSIDAYISLIGCDSTTNDPWVDASDVKPIIDFENAAYAVVFGQDTFWWLERLVVKDKDGTYLINAGSSASNDRLYFKDCDFDGNLHTGYGLSFDHCYDVMFDGCTFDNFPSLDLNIIQSSVTLKNCTFTAHAGDNKGIQLSENSTLYLDTVTFSGTFDDADLNLIGGSRAYCRNVNWSGSGITMHQGATVLSEDDEAVFEGQLATYYEGTIARDTGTVRGGGADSSAKLTANANCGLIAPLTLGDPMTGFSRYWATKDVQINIAVYARVGDAWDTALAAAECYTTYSYLSNAASAARVEVQSTQQIANDESWTALTSGNFTPLQTGWVYIWAALAEYEDAGEFVYVDIKPVVTEI